MRTRLTTLAIGLGLTLALAACGSDDSPDVVAAPADSAEAAESTDSSAAPAADTPTSGPADVLFGDSAVGEILVGPDGRSLYGFTNDVNAVSTCYGTCADAWPPVTVSDDWVAGPGLDFGIFATTVREDGSRQLVAGKWPLYYFAGDAVPGDINGQGSGDVWFAVDLDGGLITDDAADAADDEGSDEEAAPGAPIQVNDTDLGEVLVTTDGLTLYGFVPDKEAGGPTCNDACADAWPPLTIDGTELPAGLDSELFSVVARDDGSNQLAIGVWPLYRFAGDAVAGETNGQGSGDNWFAAAPDGKLVGLGGGAAETDEDDSDY